jgi:hypothetical protein
VAAGASVVGASVDGASLVGASDVGASVDVESLDPPHAEIAKAPAMTRPPKRKLLRTIIFSSIELLSDEQKASIPYWMSSQSIENVKKRIGAKVPYLSVGTYVTSAIQSVASDFVAR